MRKLLLIGEASVSAHLTALSAATSEALHLHHYSLPATLAAIGPPFGAAHLNAARTAGYFGNCKTYIQHSELIQRTISTGIHPHIADRHCSRDSARARACRGDDKVHVTSHGTIHAELELQKTLLYDVRRGRAVVLTRAAATALSVTLSSIYIDVRDKHAKLKLRPIHNLSMRTDPAACDSVNDTTDRSYLPTAPWMNALTQVLHRIYHLRLHAPDKHIYLQH